ncbi:uncharacterized protein LOC128172947 isoform X2 [Crassostrea angulata]|uniref:uncharacterized protein LOC128172947 isoform X2 n=1 Tax=Magallana angulata TaxID=2784310 RepID=UPI0022B0F6B1|nr:uncharacterized protein LOC128172947 isoform X2 [Crassostrea angulata]
MIMCFASTLDKKPCNSNATITRCLILFLLALHLSVLSAMTTNNRILLSSLLVGSALGLSVYGDYDFSPSEIGLLATAFLAINHPTAQPTSTSVTCTAPGYTDHPLLGCYRIYSDTPVVYDTARQQCISDGGSLLLVNSAQEAQALAEQLGSRRNAVDPWKAEDGSPLPYTGPDTVLRQRNDAATVLVMLDSTRFAASLNSLLFQSFTCEV